MTAHDPILTEHGWEVEIVGYPESRTVEVHVFEDKADADRFFDNAQLGGLDLMEENERLRAELDEALGALSTIATTPPEGGDWRHQMRIARAAMNKITVPTR